MYGIKFPWYLALKDATRILLFHESEASQEESRIAHEILYEDITTTEDTTAMLHTNANLSDHIFWNKRLGTYLKFWHGGGVYLKEGA